MSEELPLEAVLDPKRGYPGHVTRADVVVEARSWLGTPYIHQHRAKGHGVDCAGLVIGVARRLGLVAPDFDVNGYEPTPDGKTMLAVCDKFMARIPLDSLQPGDVLVFEFKASLGPQHLGIVGDYMHGGLSLIQSLCNPDGKGSVREWRLTQRKGWKPIQAYYIPGVL